MSLNPLPSGSNAERSRRRNRQAVLGHVRSANTMGRAEIARALSLTTQTVSNIIAELLGEGMLIEKGTRSVGRGLPAMQYALNPTGGFALGVEVRPDAVFAAVLDLEGQSVASRRVPLLDTRPKNVLSVVGEAYHALIAEVPDAKNRMLGAGVVMPGPFGATGIVGKETDLTGWQDVDAEKAFSDVLRLDIMVSNDANASAMAERIAGVAQGIPTFAYLYFGTGLGLGLVHRGQLISGAFGNAGEIGHIPVRSGVLEDSLSRLSVQRHLAEHGKDAADIDTLEAYFQADDPDLKIWLARASLALGEALAIVENMFDPQTVVLGGAMPRQILDHLVDHAPKPDVSVSNRPDAQMPRLMSGTSGRMTATHGAAALILNRALTAPIYQAN